MVRIVSALELIIPNHNNPNPSPKNIPPLLDLDHPQLIDEMMTTSTVVGAVH